MATYRHKSIKRFRVGRFEFKNAFLVTLGEEDDEEFKSLVEKLPARDQNQIVQVNEESLRNSETPMTRVIKGMAQTSGTVPATSKEGGPRLTDEEVKKRMAEAASRADGGSNISTKSEGINDSGAEGTEKSEEKQEGNQQSSDEKKSTGGIPSKFDFQKK